MDQAPLRLSPETVAALQSCADEDDVTIGRIIRATIERELRRRAAAKTPVRADERLVAPLRALLAAVFADAADWSDLQSRLMRKGYRRAEAGGLILQRHPGGDRVCQGSELGYGCAMPMRKFDAPFAGHSHRWQFERQRAGC